MYFSQRNYLGASHFIRIYTKHRVTGQLTVKFNGVLYAQKREKLLMHAEGKFNIFITQKTSIRCCFSPN